MLAGLIHLVACRAAAALRARASAPGEWPELLFLVLVGCSLLVLAAFVLWPLAAVAMLVLAGLIGRELLRK
ncbi:hypothetical protein LJR290_007704 [Variovorax sp. LjRoot290]|uniref:hypothetical protein n=1 Tax=unclassified Variovorax TaxID=663243 RepID=UPI003ECF724A